MRTFINSILAFFEDKNYLPAKQLGITKKEKYALVDVLLGLENQRYVHVNHEEIENAPVTECKLFDMSLWLEKEYNNCATIGCIGGWATWAYRNLFGDPHYNGFADSKQENNDLYNLFYPYDLPIVTDEYDEEVDYPWGKITTEEATQALRNFLTTGKANWKEVIPS